MSANWWESVCRAPGTSTIADIRHYSLQRKLNKDAPIDLFLSRIEQLVKSGTPAFLNANSQIAPLYFIGLISYTENYFRDLFSRILELCPTSQGKSAGRDIKLGSVIWFRTGTIERGAFEGFSFASADNIIDASRKFFDHSISEKSDCYALLQEFDRLCELRHGVVHSGGVLSGKNALKLQLPRTKEDTLVFVDFNRFQESAEVCTALVTAVNIEFFRLLGNRWRNVWPKTVPGWNSKMQNAFFRRLWKLFYSSNDGRTGVIPAPLDLKSCKREILKP